MKKRIYGLIKLIAMVPFFIAVVSNLAFAESKAISILERADKAFTSAKIYSVATMTIYKSGKPRTVVEIESYSMSSRDKYYSLTIYRKPARLKGTAYLVIDNDLWVRFSSTGRIRKLSSSARENSAGGSDFSYNDMGESGKGMAEKYNSRLLSDRAVIDRRKCYEIELTPKESGKDKSSYEKVVVFIDRENYHYLKIDYYKSGANIKSLYLSDYRTVGGVDYPFKLTMESHTEPTKTEIITTEIELDSPKVKKSLFTTSYLKRIR